MTQGQLGEAIGDVPQTTISRWEKGLVEMTHEQTRSIELALNLELGYLAEAVGYFRPSQDSADIIRALNRDSNLLRKYRGDVIQFYKTYVALSAREARERNGNGNGRR